MQWILLAVWSAIIAVGARLHSGWLKTAIALGLFGAMFTQLVLLKLDGLLRWTEVLPFHLCSLFGVLSIFMLWHAPAALFEACCFLGAPGAFITLFFPAVVPCSHPFLMALAFYQLHVLVALMPFYWYCTEKPLPDDPQRTLILGSGYLAFAAVINRLFNTNYLFLEAAPEKTPLAMLFVRGHAFYVCSLFMLCMLVFSLMKQLYSYLRK